MNIYQLEIVRRVSKTATNAAVAINDIAKAEHKAVQNAPEGSEKKSIAVFNYTKLSNAEEYLRKALLEMGEITTAGVTN